MMAPYNHTESLDQVVQAWRDRQNLTCSPGTVQQRADTVRRLAEHAAHRHHQPTIDPRDLGPDDITAYLARPLSANARATYFRALSSWFDWLHQTSRLARNPMVGMRSPADGDEDPDPLTDDEVDRVLAGATGPLLHVLILGLWAGLRAHETATFKGDWIRGDNIRVEGKGQVIAVIPLADPIAALAEHMPSDWWFPSPFARREHVLPGWVTNTVTDRFAEVGIDHGSSHRLRHTYGTRLQEQVGDTRIVQELMRHKSIKTTQRYTKVSDIRKRQAIRSLPPLSA